MCSIKTDLISKKLRWPKDMNWVTNKIFGHALRGCIQSERRDPSVGKLKRFSRNDGLGFDVREPNHTKYDKNSLKVEKKHSYILFFH